MRFFRKVKCVVLAINMLITCDLTKIIDVEVIAECTVSSVSIHFIYIKYIHILKNAHIAHALVVLHYILSAYLHGNKA